MRGLTIKEEVDTVEFRRSTKHVKYREETKPDAWKCIPQEKKWEIFFSKESLK